MKNKPASRLAFSPIYPGMVGMLMALIANGQPQWIEQGPGPDTVPNNQGYTQVSGAVQAIAADPSNADRVFIGAVNGGVWRTDNATAASPTWVPLTDQAASLSIACLALSPLDPSHNTLFAGIGRTSSNYPLNGGNGGPLPGLLQTTDGGNSWVVLGTGYFGNQSVSRVLPSSTSVQTIFVTAGNGLFRSDDGGQTWSKKSGANGLPDSNAFVDIVQDPGNSQRLFAALYYPQPQVYRSEDLGTNWVNLTGVLGLANNSAAPTRLAISAVPDDAGAHWVYLLVNNGSGPVVSKDHGSSWTLMDPLPRGADPYRIELVVSPSDVNVVFAMSNYDPGHYRGNANAPAGSQWYQVDAGNAGGTNPHTDGRDWVFSANPNIMYESDDGGIYRLRNPFSNTPTWESVIGNLRVTEFASVAYDSVNHIIFGACSDNSIPQQTTPGAIAWGANEDSYGDGFQTGVDNTSTAGVSVHYSSQQILERFHRRSYTTPTTVTSDVSTTPIINGTANLGYNMFEGNLRPGSKYPGSVRWAQTWVVNRIDGRRLLMGTDYLYESFDRANTFTSLGGVGQQPNGDLIPLKPVGQVTAYAYGHVQDANVFYVGTTGQGNVSNVTMHLLWVRSSGTGYPAPIDSYQNAGGLIPYGIAMDPNDWRRAYVVDSSGQVWQTIDAGAGWRNVTANLGAFSTDLRNIIVENRSHVAGDVAILVGGLGGAFYAHDTPTGGGINWSRLGVLPNAIVSDIHYNSTDDVLVVGIFGRGAWKMSYASHWLFGACLDNIQCDPNVVWLDFAYNGTQTGCYNGPYNTLAGGIVAVPAGATLAIKAGSTPATATITKPMTIESCGGPAIIGR